MKKLIAMLLLASLMMSIAVSACADGTIDRATAEKDDFPKIGVTLYYPDDFKVEKGLYTAAADDDMLGPGIYFVQCNYIGVSMEWYESALHTEDIKQEDIQKYMNSTMALLMLIGIDQNRNAEDICAAYKALTGADVLSPDDMTEVGRFEDITWYLLDKDFTGNYQNLEPEYASEYDSLHALAGTIASNADYYRPVGTYDTIADQTVSFETTDLDGNPVTSKDIFSKYDVTMINVWATWCSACLSELSELEEINNRLAEKNCAIVAILGDGDEEEAVALGKKQLEEAGCTYLCLRPFDGWEEVFIMNEGWPTSFFFDSTGKMVSKPIAGAAVTRYESRIDDILNGAEANETIVNNGNENQANAYRIFVVDQSANPVVGAMVQFCTADTCQIGKTDDNGMASFDNPEGVYEVHILKVPKGYVKNDSLYTTPETYSDMTIVVEAESAS